MGCRGFGGKLRQGLPGHTLTASSCPCVTRVLDFGADWGVRYSAGWSRAVFASTLPQIVSRRDFRLQSVSVSFRIEAVGRGPRMRST